jgi:UTP-glucose-1-phosphate uridylyltransferase
MDYSVFDAMRAGFGKVVFVIRKDFEEDFRKVVLSKYADHVPCEVCFQGIDNLPEGFTRNPERTKPWGTNHAVLMAKDLIKEPFMVINADDFYGRDAFAKLSAFLQQSAAADGKFHFAMVGYKLDLTLSDNGSVARGICKVDGGKLASVTEMTKLVRVPGGAENCEDEANPVKLTGEERVSMNLWGFTPELFDALEARFPAWLEKNGSAPKSEWYIPFVVDELIHEGKADVEVLPTDSNWFGVTYREDKPFVTAEIGKLVAAGEYPQSLFVK